MSAVPNEAYDQGTWFDFDEDDATGVFGSLAGLTQVPEPVSYGRDDLVREDWQTNETIKGEVFIPNNFCGTAACVLGHAASDPEFRQEGLYMEIIVENGKFSRSNIIFQRPGSEGFQIDSDAGADFFDLTDSEAGALFSDMADYWSSWDDEAHGYYTFYADYAGQDITPAIVARAIQAFADTDGESMRQFYDHTLARVWRIEGEAP